MFRSPIVPSFYLAGDRREQVYHTRIRNQCSNLNADLFRNHISDTSQCDCGHNVEDAEHFFFQCNRFENQRLQLFTNTRQFHPISIYKLLFGNENLTDDENQNSFYRSSKIY